MRSKNDINVSELRNPVIKLHRLSPSEIAKHTEERKKPKTLDIPIRMTRSRFKITQKDEEAVHCIGTATVEHTKGTGQSKTTGASSRKTRSKSESQQSTKNKIPKKKYIRFERARKERCSKSHNTIEIRNSTINNKANSARKQI